MMLLVAGDTNPGHPNMGSPKNFEVQCFREVDLSRVNTYVL